MSVVVVNVRRERPAEMVYIGRTCSGLTGSILGNPHKVGWCPVCKTRHERGSTIELYREWLRAEYRKNGEVRRELERLADLAEQGSLVLGCWCKPAPCHGDVVKEAVEGILRQRGQG